MPTWRDTGDDFIRQCGFDFDRLNKVMIKHNSLFLLKMHPDSRLFFDIDYSNIVIIDKDIDIYPILPFTDCLITDFSSIYFDYILMKQKQIILFLPDYDDYINKNRSLKYSYDDVMKGIKITNFNQLVLKLDNEDSSQVIEEINDVCQRFWNPKYKDMEELVLGIYKIINK